MAEPDRTAEEPVDGVPFVLNGKELVAHGGELVIEAAQRHGVYIPRFCYHSRLRPVGMCRMCLVEVDTGRGPSLQPSCMLEVTPEMKVDTESTATIEAQDGVLELLLLNHPLDCPVCDKGGECPLQDHTIAYGPGETRFVEEKRHYEKPIAISELVHLDRERCILCDRCTRFARDVAGDPLIHFMDRGSQTQVNTFPDHPFASYFSGNTVQICPVGALTARPYRFKARPWDLEEAESTCTSCSVGCRISVQSSRDHVVRRLGVDVDAVNRGWLCDKGRFDFEAIDQASRLGEPLVRRGDALVEVSWAEALQQAADTVRRTCESKGPTAVGVIGGARLTNEAAYAWAKLAKSVIGTDNVDCQLGDGLPPEVVLGVPRATIADACRPGGTVLLLAPDLKEELPVLYLRLKAAVDDGVRVVEVAPRTTPFGDHAAVSLHPRPGEAGAVVRALLGSRSGALDGIDDADLARGAALLAEAAGPVTVVVGRQSVAEQPQPIVEAVAAVLEHLDGARVLPVLRRSNVNGALDMGLAPGLLPGRTSLEDGRAWYGSRWGRLPDAPGLDTIGMLRAAADGEIETLVLVGADLFDVPDRALAKQALDATTVVVLELFETETTGLADVVLPAAGPGEAEGSTTSIEGRLGPLTQVVNPPGTARPDWIVAADLASRLGSDLGLESPEQIWAEIAELAPSYRGLDRPTASPAGPTEGAVVQPADVGGDLPPLLRFVAPDEQVELPAADSYSLRLVATRRLYDRGTLVQRSPSLAGLAAGTGLGVNPYDFDRLGVTEGDEVTITSSSARVVGRVVADEGVPRGSAHMAFNQPGLEVAELIDAGEVVTDVRVEMAGDDRPSTGGGS